MQWLHYRRITKVRALIRRRAVSSRDLVNISLRRIAALDETLGAVSSVDLDESRNA